MAIKANQLNRNSVVSINSVPHTVTSISVQTPSARGAASLYKVRFRNAKTGQKLDQTYRGDDALEEVDLVRKDVQYLYKSGDAYTFMDLEDYSQFDLQAGDIESAIPYLLDDMEGITALISDEKVLALLMPDTVEIEVTETGPSMKGASATARTKPATLTTGLIVQVPEYISTGEIIKIDTRNNQFLSRS